MNNKQKFSTKELPNEELTWQQVLDRNAIQQESQETLKQLRGGQPGLGYYDRFSHIHDMLFEWWSVLRNIEDKKMRGKWQKSLADDPEQLGRLEALVGERIFEAEASGFHWGCNYTLERLRRYKDDQFRKVDVYVKAGLTKQQAFERIATGLGKDLLSFRQAYFSRQRSRYGKRRRRGNKK